MEINIRDWKTKDLDVYRYWNAGKHKWMDFNGPYYPTPSIAEIDHRIIQLKSQIDKQSWPEIRERMVIVEKENDQMLGTVNWYWQSQETNWKSIGIALYDDACWGKAYGAQALRLWIDYLFDIDPTIVRLDLRTWSGNIGMMKLASKLGFIEEARFRNARIVNGEFYDSIALGILRNEWVKQKFNF